MKKISHQLVAVTTAYAFGLPLLPALAISTLPDIDVKWMKGNSLLTAHRGITHHLLLGIFIILLGLFSKNKMIMAFAIGYASHIFADMLTTSGVPYWTNKDRIALDIFSTGSLLEYLYVMFYMLAVFSGKALSHSLYVPVDVQLIQKLVWNFYHNVNIISSLF